MKLNLKKIDKVQAVEIAVAHVEKAVFAVFALLFLMFCLGALQQKAFDKTPQQVQEKAGQVRNTVENSQFDPATDVPAVPEQPEEHPVPELVWVTHEIWNRPLSDVGKRRPEPKFLALEDVRVASGYGAVATRPDGDAKAEGVVDRQRPDAPVKPQADAGGGGGLMGAARKHLGGGRPGGDPAAGFGAAQQRASRLDSQGEAMGGGDRAGAVGSAKQGIPRRLPQRRPRASQTWISRSTTDMRSSAEVSPGSSADVEPDNWQPVNVKLSIAEEENFAGVGADPVAQLHKDQALTQPLPNLLGKEHDKSVAHPKIPLADDQAQNSGGAAPQPNVMAPPAARPGGLMGAARGGLMGAVRGGPQGFNQPGGRRYRAENRIQALSLFRLQRAAGQIVPLSRQTAAG